MIQDEMSEKIVTVTEEIAMKEGTSDINVRRILKELNITNRVFYNRFGSIEQVLEIIYEKSVIKMRENISTAYSKDKDFFEAVTDVVASTLATSYESRMNFNQYVFDSDSRSQKNYEWWKAEIERLIEYGKGQGVITKDVDTHIMSYSIWCFIRGYIADALCRGIPREEAEKSFRYSFSVLLKGMSQF